MRTFSSVYLFSPIHDAVGSYEIVRLFVVSEEANFFVIYMLYVLCYVRLGSPGFCWIMMCDCCYKTCAGNRTPLGANAASDGTSYSPDFSVLHELDGSSDQVRASLILIIVCYKS